MKPKMVGIRARCSEDFKNQVLEFLKEFYPEEDESWLVRAAVKQFMTRHADPREMSSLGSNAMHSFEESRRIIERQEMEKAGLNESPNSGNYILDAHGKKW